MRLIPLLLAAVLATFAVSPALAAEPASLQAVLVAASNVERPADPALERYLPTLRRVLRFASYRRVGEGRVSVAVPGAGTVGLGGEQQLRVNVEEADGERLRVRAEWRDGDRVLMNTVLVLRRGVPAVLGGPPRGDEVLALIVVAS